MWTNKLSLPVLILAGIMMVGCTTTQAPQKAAEAGSVSCEKEPEICTALLEKEREAHAINKRELEACNRNRPSLTQGEYWPCCMSFSVAGDRAKTIFNKMPDSSLVQNIPEGTCLSGDIVKLKEGMLCILTKGDDNFESYSCRVDLNYATGTTERIDLNRYLHCGEDADF